MERSEAIPAALRHATIPRAVLGVLRRLHAAGFRSWLVGGAVRDLLIHRNHKSAADFDVATPALPEEVKRLFRRVIPTGIEHGTVTVLEGDDKIEVTTFRGEGTYVDGRRPSSVSFHTDLEEDLARRDFTMNALAYDPVDHQFRDPFGGQDDIRRHLIRAVGDPVARFREDGLRPLRAVRFSAQLGYELERRTREAIPHSFDVVRQVSAERVGEEISKLVKAKSPHKALRLLERTRLLEIVFPKLAGLPHERVNHAIAFASVISAEPERRLAALLHCLTPEEVAQSLMALRFPNRVVNEASALVRELGCSLEHGLEPIPDSGAALRRWLSRVGASRVNALLELREAEATILRRKGVHSPAEQRKLRRRVEVELDRRPPLTINELALDGHQIMKLLHMPAGRQVGQVLKYLLGEVLEDPSRNTEEGLRASLEAWRARKHHG